MKCFKISYSLHRVEAELLSEISGQVFSVQFIMSRMTCGTEQWSILHSPPNRSVYRGLYNNNGLASLFVLFYTSSLSPGVNINIVCLLVYINSCCQTCVRFADYGDFGLVSFTNLQALPDEFRELPPMAIQGCLHGM